MIPVVQLGPSKAAAVCVKEELQWIHFPKEYAACLQREKLMGSEDGWMLRVCSYNCTKLLQPVTLMYTAVGSPSCKQVRTLKGGVCLGRPGTEDPF